MNSIEDEGSNVILDGETSAPGSAAHLRARPCPCVRSPPPIMTSPLERLVAQELSQASIPASCHSLRQSRASRHRQPGRAVLRFVPAPAAARRADARFLSHRVGLAAAYDKPWMARANALIPPNVFPFQHDGSEPNMPC